MKFSLIFFIGLAGFAIGEKFGEEGGASQPEASSEQAVSAGEEDAEVSQTQHHDYYASPYASPYPAHGYGNFAPPPLYDGHGGYGYFNKLPASAVYHDVNPWTPVVKKAVVPVVKKVVAKPYLSVGPAYKPAIIASGPLHKEIGNYHSGYYNAHAYAPVVAPVAYKSKPVVKVPIAKPIVPLYKPTPLHVTPSLSYGYSYKLVPTFAYGPGIVNDHALNHGHGPELPALGGYADGHGHAGPGGYAAHEGYAGGYALPAHEAGGYGHAPLGGYVPQGLPLPYAHGYGHTH